MNKQNKATYFKETRTVSRTEVFQKVDVVSHAEVLKETHVVSHTEILEETYTDCQPIPGSEGAWKETSDTATDTKPSSAGNAKMAKGKCTEVSNMPENQVSSCFCKKVDVAKPVRGLALLGTSMGIMMIYNIFFPSGQMNLADGVTLVIQLSGILGFTFFRF